MKINQEIIPQLRNIALSKQGLSSQAKFGNGLSGTLNAINQLGYIQIDTLYVVERAHHHALWSRIPDYEPSNLNKLINKKQIFEYWYHAAAYLPIEDYRYALLQMKSIRDGKSRYYNNIDKYLMNEILTRINIDGPLRLRDLDKKNKTKGSWWHSGPEKRALEKLFMQGDLMICERDGMGKVYDLTQNCLPNNINLTEPTLEEYAIYLLNTTIKAHGVFTWKQLVHLKSSELKNIMRKLLDKYIDSNILIMIKLSNTEEFYVEKISLEQIPIVNDTIKILSPFDNIVIHRERLNALFKFDYKIECYVTAAKRVYGYFCLPILVNNQFVGRVDCKAHRATQQFEVIKLHLEDNQLNKDELFFALKNELQNLANFNKCPLLIGI